MKKRNVKDVSSASMRDATKHANISTMTISLPQSRTTMVILMNAAV